MGVRESFNHTRSVLIKLKNFCDVLAEENTEVLIGMRIKVGIVGTLRTGLLKYNIFHNVFDELFRFFHVVFENTQLEAKYYRKYA